MMTDPGAVPRDATPLVDDLEGVEEGSGGAGSAKEGGEPRQRVRKYCRR